MVAYEPQHVNSFQRPLGVIDQYGMGVVPFTPSGAEAPRIPTTSNLRPTARTHPTGRAGARVYAGADATCASARSERGARRIESRAHPNRETISAVYTAGAPTGHPQTYLFQPRPLHPALRV